ncbi:M23 family metallopeptidase [Streptomyces sp. NBC_01142]|uniref:M23 family metallopeptidase n=1 Tax=Streptomyces sp. NBC_01142 TaxID=2975865 RepID=UPI00225ADE7C|nr:M23 family metallopeptidase [Streptomyces sp. NBC_01142]MCX4824149.1 M23 family metallopeptidase [Streptomyces sp. NBC_01142]
MSVRKLLMILYRCCIVAFLALVVVATLTEMAMAWVWLPAAIVVAIALGMSRKARAEQAQRPPTVEVDAPVTGRWSALNSPADKVPSHGTHAYGQTYAIDIVADPEAEGGVENGAEKGVEGGAEKGADNGARPPFRWLWPIVRRNSDFPAFGAPLLSVADATVVHASDSQRDHLSRNSLPALVFMLLIEGAVREISGASRIVGNHIVLDLGDGTYAMYAHVQRGSLAVREGDRVLAGQQLARCGNSGNSSEPHVHFQLMDGPDLDAARGIPFRWRGVGVPRNGEAFTAGEQALPAV